MRRGWADDLRKVRERQKKNKSNDDEGDDCVILDGDPYKAPDRVGNVSGNESDELVVVAEKGQIACRDYPHARHLCVTFPFNTHPHEKYCHLCHCYVCDTLSPCFYWGTGKSSDDHCHSTDKEEVWRELRQRSKEEGKLAQLPVSSLLETTLSNESLPHQTFNCCQPLNINEERVVELDMVSLALDQSLVQDDRLTGTVKWFDSHKGYGFITREDGGEDLFVHHSSIKSKGHKSLAEGEKVEFAIDIDNHGRGKAINVSGPGGSSVQGSSGGDNGCMEFSARGGRIPGNRIYGGRTSGSSRPGGSFVQGSGGGDNGCMEFSARGGRIQGNRIYGGRTSGSSRPGGSFVQGSSGGDNGCMEFSARGGRIPGNRIYGGRTSGSSRHGEYGRNKDVGASSFGESVFQGSTKDNNYGNSDTDALKCYKCWETGHLARNCSGRGGGNDNNFRVRVARGGGREDYGSRASGSYRGGDYGRNRATGVSSPGESFLQETTRDNDSNSNSDTLKCFNCGEFGHLTRNCDGGGSGSNVLNGSDHRLRVDRGSVSAYRQGDLGRAAGVSNLDKSTFQGITRDKSYYVNFLREREIHICSKCGELGHSMRDCVVGGNNDSNNRQRRGFDGGTNRGRGRYFNFSNNRYNETNRAVAQRSSSGNLVRGSTRGSNRYGERGNSARDHHSLESGGGGCYICGKPGHRASDCYKESGGGRSEDGSSSCTSGEAGHLLDWS